MIELQRLRQQRQQLNAIAPKQVTATIATYKGRDPQTGDRILQGADGGVVRAAWIASSQPQSVPPLIVPVSTIGLPGYASQKPSK